MDYYFFEIPGIHSKKVHPDYEGYLFGSVLPAMLLWMAPFEQAVDHATMYGFSFFEDSR